MTSSFIGIAGVSSTAEAREVAVLVRRENLSIFSENSHTAMLGFQVSQKSMKNGFSEGNRRVPRTSELPKILRSLALDTRLAIHYYTRDQEKLVDEVSAVLSLPETSRTESDIYTQMLVDSIQINGVWPTMQQITEINLRYPDIQIILQVSQGITDGRTPMQVAEKIRGDHPDGISYLILDPSRGKGIGFDLDIAVSTYEAIKTLGIKAEIIFAGGFDNENVKRKVQELSKRLGTKKFSIDAEGGLRERLGDGYGNDVLNLVKVEGYLRGAADAFA